MRHFTLLMLLLTAIGLPAANAQSPLNADGLQFLLRDYLYREEPGAVLYVAHGAQTWAGAFGAANIATVEPLRSDDLFRIGSITKPMVATAVLQLAEDGELRLDDPIANYLPADGVANIANADRATVRQTLQMTSGISDYSETDRFYELAEANPTGWWTPANALATVYGEPADFAAGTDYVYSNSNYLLAQLIIERITGQSLALVLYTRIFAPLGMESCYLETEATFGQNIVRGYEIYDDEFYDITEYNDGVGLGDGGVICTAADLAKFPRGLINGDLLGDAMLAEMLTTVEDDGGSFYGLGIGYDEGEYGMEVAHDGSTSGFASNMVYLPDDDVVVVVLTNNFDSDILYDLTDDALAVVFGDD